MTPADIARLRADIVTAANPDIRDNEPTLAAMTRLLRAVPALFDGYEAAMAVVRAVASANLVDYACGASRCALCGVDLRNEEMDEHDHSKHAPGCAWVASVAMSEGGE